MFSYCQRLEEHEFQFRSCQTYSGTFDLYDLATGAWQAACILYGGGCALLVVSSVLSICTICLKTDTGEKLGTVASYIQIVSGKTALTTICIDCSKECCAEKETRS